MKTSLKVEKTNKIKKSRKILGLLKSNKSNKTLLTRITPKSSNDNSDIWEERFDKLNQNMLNRLESAKFRIMNEKLCKLSSHQAKTFFEDNAEDYKSYQLVYNKQQQDWPEKPVEKIISYLKTKSSDKVIVDMGCGKGLLAKSLKNCVHSFDLVSSGPNITACDMAKVPLPNKSVDIVVFCLSLMGKDLSPYILEANRILKLQGHIIIAELTSRFDKISAFLRSMEKFGFKLSKKNQKNNCFWIFEFKKITNPKSNAKLIMKPFLYKKR